MTYFTEDFTNLDLIAKLEILSREIVELMKADGGRVLGWRADAGLDIMSSFRRHMFGEDARR